MAEGWILLHRKIQENPIWSSNQPFDMRSAWVDLLLMANHEDVETIFDYKPIVIHRGQCLTSVRKLSLRWSWSKDRVLKYLRCIERERMINRESNNQRTLITIENYDFYQCEQDTKRTQTRHDKDTGSPQTNNEKNEKKNINKKINNIIPPTLDMVREYCQERNNSVDPEAFVSFYESKGWMIGKNKMKDWQSAVRTWERSRDRKPDIKPKPTTNQKIHNYKERDDYDFDELMQIATKR